MIFGKSLIDFTLPEPEKCDSGDEDRDDYDILLDKSYRDVESNYDDELLDIDEDVLDGGSLDSGHIIDDDEIAHYDNLRQQLEEQNYPYWTPYDKILD